MRNSGAAFLTTIIILGLIVISGSALSLMLLKDAYMIKRLNYSTQAYYLAEAGIERGIQDLWDNAFAVSRFPIASGMGGGNYSVTVNQAKWLSDSILLITSTGTVRDISRPIRVAVKANILPSFNYAILSNGKTLVSQRGTVNCGIGSGVHSNSTAWGGLLTTSAVQVTGIFFPCYINGKASAVGRARATLQGVITGTATNNAPGVSLPSFDVNFFNYYFNLANASGDVYTPGGGTQHFTVDVAPGNGVAYVNGNASLEGDITVTGCIVATGNIWVNSTTRGEVTQNQVGSLPALMSRTGGIWIWDPTTLNGLIYAAGNVTFFSLFGQLGDVTINGSIMSSGNVTVMDMATLNYVKQNPPGLGANPIGWILNWSE